MFPLPFLLLPAFTAIRWLPADGCLHVGLVHRANVEHGNSLHLVLVKQPRAKFFTFSNVHYINLERTLLRLNSVLPSCGDTSAISVTVTEEIDAVTVFFVHLSDSSPSCKYKLSKDSNEADDQEDIDDIEAQLRLSFSSSSSSSSSQSSLKSDCSSSLSTSKRDNYYSSSSFFSSDSHPRTSVTRTVLPHHHR